MSLYQLDQVEQNSINFGSVQNLNHPILSKQEIEKTEQIEDKKLGNAFQQQLEQIKNMEKEGQLAQAIQELKSLQEKTSDKQQVNILNKKIKRNLEILRHNLQIKQKNEETQQKSQQELQQQSSSDLDGEEYIIIQKYENQEFHINVKQITDLQQQKQIIVEFFIEEKKEFQTQVFEGDKLFQLCNEIFKYYSNRMIFKNFSRDFLLFQYQNKGKQIFYLPKIIAEEGIKYVVEYALGNNLKLNMQELEQINKTGYIEEEDEQQNNQEIDENATIVENDFSSILESFNSTQGNTFKQKIQGELDTIRFFKNKDIIILQDLTSGGQGSITLAYSTKELTFLVIKSYFEEITFKMEQNLYNLIEEYSLNDLIMKRREVDEQSQVIVLERGACDLQQFCKIRAEQEIPLMWEEIAYIFQRILFFMDKFHEKGFSLCDIKPNNVIVQYNETKTVLHLYLTDVGSIYKHNDEQTQYPIAATHSFFDTELLNKVKSQFREYTETEMIYSELFTLARTMQFCIHPYPKDEILKKHNISKFFQTYGGSNQSQNSSSMAIFEEPFANLLKRILLEQPASAQNKSSLDPSVFNYKYIQQEFQKIYNERLEKNKKMDKEIHHVLEMDNKIREWQNSQIKKKDYSQYSLIQLQQEFQFLYEYQLYENAEIVGKITIDKMEEYRNQNQENQNDHQFILPFYVAVMNYTFPLCALGKDKEVIQLFKKYTAEIEVQLQKDFKFAKKCQHLQGNGTHVSPYYILSLMYLNMGDIYRKYGYYEESIEKSQRAINILDDIIREQKEKNLYRSYQFKAYFNIGAVLRSQQKYEQCETYYQDLKKKIEDKDKNDEIYPKIISVIAELYSNQNKLDEAEQWFLEAKDIFDEMYKGKKKNLDYGQLFNNLGMVYDQKKDIEKAVECYEKSLAIKIEILGQNCIEVATTYNNIAIVHHNSGDYEKAEQNYLKCLGIKEKYYGNEAIQLTGTLNNMSVLYLKLEQNEKAAEFVKKSHKIRLKVLGKEHSMTQNTLKQFLKFYSQEEEQKLYEEVQQELNNGEKNNI